MTDRPPIKSPFPGMDPFMQRHWRDVHASLMAYIRDALQPHLPADLYARIEENVLLDETGVEPVRRNPDVAVVELPPAWAPGGRGADPAAVIDQPVVIKLDVDPLTERHIEITEGEGGRVVTAIQVISPWNKFDGSGRDRYVQKREQYLSSDVNLVEVDLVRGGRWWSLVAPFHVPPKYRSTYRVTVRRAGQWSLDLYPFRLDHRLPTIAVPLRPTDPDVALALQPLIEQVYRNGRYDRTDYAKPCDPPLEGAEAEWAAGLLREAGRG